MPQTACFTDLFQINTPYTASKSFVPIQNKIAGHVSENMGRPFIPYCGAVLDATLVPPDAMLIPDTIAHNITFIATFFDFFKEARLASVNFFTDQVGAGFSDITSDLYAGYLAKKTINVGEAGYIRYFQVAEIIKNFWTDINPALTLPQYYDALTGLENKIIAMCSKDLYIPPAIYNWDAASALSIDATAWKLASANWRGLLTVEFLQ